MADIFKTKLTFLSGVGEHRATILEKELGVKTYEDLLYYFPFRYIDRTRIYQSVELADAEGTLVQFRARIVSKSMLGEGSKKRLRVVVRDGSGAVELTWFKGYNWIEKRLEIGREYLIFGRPQRYQDIIQMIHPEVETVEKALSQPVLSKMQGVYSSTERLGTVLGAKGMHKLLVSLWTLLDGKIKESLPPEIMRQYGLLGLRDALFNIHFPQSQELLAAAQLRLKFEELFGLQLSILSRRGARLGRRDGYIFNKVGEIFNSFYSQKLPFPLTGAQMRVIKEIRADMTSGCQMNRLMQGDVGSGKTVTSLATMLLAIDNGYQCALMVPTEILARQHFASIQKMCEGLPIKIAILTGSSKAKERRESTAGATSGEIDLLIGTHALIEDGVQFARLGYVVIDEQHRFGVEQRARLWSKSSATPHILVMTATPIPRTLAMTLYGDLEVSVIDELPPGRKPIVTHHFREGMIERVIGFIRKEIAQGRQAYVVYPIIEESEKMDYWALTQGEELFARYFPLPDYQVAVCHGKMKPADKEEQMRRFKAGEAQILIATTVIEVGVDVPNATIMLIMSAERFGLSQLHQLRGRVGRGGEQSYCVLITSESISSDSLKRMEAMCETTDGFRLSELDLKLRGAGDIYGTQQSGEALDLHIANPTRDVQILTLARDAAQAILEQDPELNLPAHALLKALAQKHSAPRDYSTVS